MDAKNGEKVVVAMSGGVDSSVAASLLKEQGYEVVGLYMRVGAEQPPCDDAGDVAENAHQGCSSSSDAKDARFVAEMLDIPLHSLDFQDDFEPIISYFVDEYARGRTPNPCVVCNDRLKFGKILRFADSIGARFIATGHYARIELKAGMPMLMRGVDPSKDQSYVLFGLDEERLSRVLFPVGSLQKHEVRTKAYQLGLPNREKPESMEICFVPDQKYARLVKERRPEVFREGDVVDKEGNVLGKHPGIGNFTIGQRRGLRIAAGVPIYVTALDPDSNTVTVGEKDDLLSTKLKASLVQMRRRSSASKFRASVQIRYQHTATPASVEIVDDSSFVATFDEPQSAVTPGQAAVLYDGDTVIGGGWIDSAS